MFSSGFASSTCRSASFPGSSDPMSFWRSMPVGMHLRSNWSATNIGEPKGPLTLDNYIADTGDEFGSPVPLDKFISYGEWFQSQAVPDVDRRRVARLEQGADGFKLQLDDGEQLSARRVVVAAGIENFPWRPAGFTSSQERATSRILMRN